MEKTIEIPEGYEARIESNKVILERKENEDERVSKAIKMYVEDMPDTFGFAHGIVKEDMLTYLERQKEQKAIEGVIKNITKNKEAATKFLKSAGIMDENGELAKMYRSEQKPAEWSEVDEALLKEIVSFFKDGTTKLQHDLDLYAGFLENRLKSLHPQPHWKPSEEQMETLERWLLDNEFKGDSRYVYPIFESLYNDLKKL